MNSPGNVPDIHFCSKLSSSLGHSAPGSTVSMMNCSDTIGNRTRQLPVCHSLLSSYHRHSPVKELYIT